MANLVVLADYLDASRALTAGTIIDGELFDVDALVRSGCALAPLTPSIEALLPGFRAQRAVNPHADLVALLFANQPAASDGPRDIEAGALVFQSKSGVAAMDYATVSGGLVPRTTPWSIAFRITPDGRGGHGLGSNASIVSKWNKASGASAWSIARFGSGLAMFLGTGNTDAWIGLAYSKGPRVSLIDLYAFVSDAGMFDSLHPNSVAQLRLGEEIAVAIAEILPLP